MPKQSLTARVQRRAGKEESDSPMVRHWKLLQQLSSSAVGATVFELADAMNVHPKSIRRDLLLLKRMGFDVSATVKKRGLKVWRIRHPFERLKNKRKQYRSIGDSLAILVEQARTVGDSSLVADLEAAHKKVIRKAR